MIVDPDFPDHWKTRMLVGLLGDECAPVYILRLWAHCQLRRNWIFDNLPCAALAALCRFPGHANKFESSMASSGFVRRDGHTLIVHEWDVYNASLLASWKNGGKGGRPPTKKPDGQPSKNPEKTHGLTIGEERKGEEVEHTHSARESELVHPVFPEHRHPPSLDALNAHAHTAGIPPEVAEKFFHEAESRTFAPSGMWTDFRGQEMGNWKSALQAYWLGWQNRTQKGKTHGRNSERDRDADRTGFRSNAGASLRKL